MTAVERTIDEWGRSIFRGKDAIELLYRDCDISKLFIEMTPEIEAYNAVCKEHDKLNYIIQPIMVPEVSPSEDAAIRQSTWWMPDDYVHLDIRTKLVAMCQTDVEKERVMLEMDMFEERGLLPVLRLMCFLVDRWRQNGVVWGVGRGSSVASYCLFLIGVHRINSLAYNLPIDEFLK